MYRVSMKISCFVYVCTLQMQVEGEHSHYTECSKEVSTGRYSDNLLRHEIFKQTKTPQEVLKKKENIQPEEKQRCILRHLRVL